MKSKKTTKERPKTKRKPNPSRGNLAQPAGVVATEHFFEATEDMVVIKPYGSFQGGAELAEYELLKASPSTATFKFLPGIYGQPKTRKVNRQAGAAKTRTRVRRIEAKLDELIIIATSKLAAQTPAAPAGPQPDTAHPGKPPAEGEVPPTPVVTHVVAVTELETPKRRPCYDRDHLFLKCARRRDSKTLRFVTVGTSSTLLKKSAMVEPAAMWSKKGLGKRRQKRRTTLSKIHIAKS